VPDNPPVNPTRADVRSLAVAVGATAGLTLLYVSVFHVTNPTTVAVSFLVIVVWTAAYARLWVAGVACVLAMLAFNFFFIPPIGTLTVASPQDWTALFAFLAASLVASNLSASVRARAAQSVAQARLLEERRSAEVARRGEELKTALLASLAHDLNTPLTAIRLAAENLQADWLSAEDTRQQREIVQSEVARLTRLFENILDMARIEAGAVSTTQEWVPVGELVEAGRTAAGPALDDHAVDVLGEESALVHVDPRLTAAALAHLLSNAARYSPSGSVITITSQVTADELEITVRDHGPGVPPADLPHLFERFYRGSNAAHITGTGMGLAIARGLVTAEGGRLWAENCPDVGAKFTIVVPADVKPLDAATLA
jgi:two-component system sensor histidine kinase KdpD